MLIKGAFRHTSKLSLLALINKVIIGGFIDELEIN